MSILLDIALVIGGTGVGLYFADEIPTITARFKASHEVADITAGLTKMRDKLLAAVEHHTETADLHTAAAMDLHAEAIASTQAASAAAAVADNLTAIVGPPAA